MSAALDQPLSVETWSGKNRHQENFPVAVLISRKRRRHVHAFYDFARNADDIADNPKMAAAEKIRRLDVMEAVLLGERQDGSPSALALRASLDETGVTPDHATHLLRAFRQDAEKTRYADWDELMEYCRYSAMPVGRYVLDLHGESRKAWQPSDALCAVLQVLNHLQDCGKDLRALDRCYLPLDMLGKVGLTPDTLRGNASPAGLRRVFDLMLDRCRELNRAGVLLPEFVADRRLRLETAVIAGLSQRLSRRLRRNDPLEVRVRLRPMDVAGSALGALSYFGARRA
jgi:farnesyl-diphosphate farnesyltransferase